jgi:hypothetical protein
MASKWHTVSGWRFARSVVIRWPLFSRWALWMAAVCALLEAELTMHLVMIALELCCLRSVRCVEHVGVVAR